MLTLRGLVADLGSVVDLLAAPQGLDAPLSGRVVVHDPSDPVTPDTGDVVAVVGAVAGSETARLFSGFAVAGAAVVVVKASSDISRFSEIAEQANIALLAVRLGVSWLHVFQLATSVLSRESFGMPGEMFAGAQAGDLFAVANVLAELVDAPVTIEDTQSRVIAFSGRQDEADAARAETILGRGVSRAWIQRLNELGVFRRLTLEREPIFIGDIAPEVMPRTAIAVRAGEQLLGSIWVASPKRLSADRERALSDAASVVALHLLRHRLAADAERTLEGELVSAVLRGGSLAAEAAGRLSLQGNGFRVIALGLDAPDRAAMDDLTRLKNFASLNLCTAANRGVAGLTGGTVYAIVSGAAVEQSNAIRDVVDAFAHRAGTLLRATVMAGIGSCVQTPSDIPSSRAEADDVLRILRGDHAQRTVAELSDLRSEVMLLRIAEAASAAPVGPGPLSLLMESDAGRRTAHVATIRAYLDAFGDVDAAARTLGVHPNTIRYRLRQIEELTRISLRNPSQRLALELELRMAAGLQAPTTSAAGVGETNKERAVNRS